jgi:nucleotide-binding universal stress UspA family protein
MERIVVGVDGSQGSREALRWAVREAGAHGARVEAVHAWHYPYAAAGPYGAAVMSSETFETAAKETLDEAVDSVDAGGLPAPMDRTLVCGGAARALLDAAKGADLLVVGSRGLGGFGGLLLGSVSHQCTHHAPCPVVIVPPAAA